MKKEEYADYQKRVSEFFEREGITNLSPSLSEDQEECPICNEEYSFEPFFSWSACECCGSRLGGNRHHCSGYCPELQNGLCFDVCDDCVYYAEYGQLDDMTMLDMETEVI